MRLPNIPLLKFPTWAAFAVSFVAIAIIVGPFTREPARNPLNSSSEVARRLAAHQEEDKDNRLTAKILERLTPQFEKLSSHNAAQFVGKIETERDSSQAADSLNGQLVEEALEVQKLREEVKNLLKYVKEVERSISKIDVAMSTPHVLKKLGQQQTGLRP